MERDVSVLVSLKGASFYLEEPWLVGHTNATQNYVDLCLEHLVINLQFYIIAHCKSNFIMMN